MMLAVICATPLLAAPYFQGCIAPVHGVAPVFCEPGGACPGGATLDETIAAQAPLAEQHLQEAQATGVLLLEDNASWERLETCLPQGTAAPTGLTKSFSTGTAIGARPGRTDGQCFYRDGTAYDCDCYYNLGALEGTLDLFVAHSPDPSCGDGGGRNALIALAPIFTDRRTVPPYLAKTPFSEDDMAWRYMNFWDAVAGVLGKSKYKRPEGQTYITLGTATVPINADQALFDISIGNEIDGYLNNVADDGRDGNGKKNAYDGDRLSAWVGYRKFFETVAPYVKGKSVTLATKTRQNLGGFLRTVTFTTRAPHYCGPTELVRRLMEPASPGAPICVWPEHGFDSTQAQDAWVVVQTALLMSAAADKWTFTLYPYFGPSSAESKLPTAPDLAPTDAAALRAQLDQYLAQMVALTELADAQGSRQKPLVIQEFAFPSSGESGLPPGDASVATIPPGSIDDPALVAEQQLFAEVAVQAVQAYNAPYRSSSVNSALGELFGAGSVPRIVAAHWFNLYDFGPDTLPQLCAAGVENGAATAGATLCSEGLFQEDATPKPAWGSSTSGFVGQVVGWNPPAPAPRHPSVS